MNLHDILKKNFYRNLSEVKNGLESICFSQEGREEHGEMFGGMMNNTLVPVCIKVKGKRDSVSDNQFYV